jgi:type IV pilus assembly protein PilB
VDRILALAVRERASDIHLEPHRSHAAVRLRVDGLLREVLEIPAAGYPAMVSRLKIISGLDIIERRLPQDGRARLATSAGAVDVRVSTLPSLHGETIVIRLLGSAAHLPHLHDLGLSDWNTTQLLQAVARPQGLILITGPTGSGKTNTLYALLADGIDASRSVLTLEDPIEIELPRITQMQVDERIGLTFARGLRASLRQDPDVVLVGEIRDQDTAELAIRAALTGHLVLSTLHTLDAASALTRLTDMGIAPYLLASSLLLIASQRLLRRPCPRCTVNDDTAGTALRELGVDPPPSPGWVHAPGCPACQHTGYRGRVPVMELIPITPDLRAPLLGGEDELRRSARSVGYPDLLQHALTVAAQGQTTLAEVLRAIPRRTTN